MDKDHVILTGEDTPRQYAIHVSFPYLGAEKCAGDRLFAIAHRGCFVTTNQATLLARLKQLRQQFPRVKYTPVILQCLPMTEPL
jgi:hypothetical protein